MVNRIPPSLNWLIDKRARLAGEVQRTKKALLKVQHLVYKLKELETSLEAVDKSLQLHEIQIDVENIKPIRPRLAPRLKFQHGEISRLVLMYLRSKNYSGPVSKTDILNHIYSKHLEIDPMPVDRKLLSVRVKHCLKRLSTLGHVHRCHHPQTSEVGLWLAKD